MSHRDKGLIVADAFVNEGRRIRELAEKVARLMENGEYGKVVSEIYALGDYHAELFMQVMSDMEKLND